MCCSLTSLSEDTKKEEEEDVSGVSLIPDVTITDTFVHKTPNGDCSSSRKLLPSVSGGRLPPPMSLRKCVLIDNKCSLQKYSVLHLTSNSSNHPNPKQKLASTNKIRWSLYLFCRYYQADSTKYRKYITFEVKLFIWVIFGPNWKSS